MHSLALGSLLAQTSGGGIASFIPLLLIVAVFYLLLIRPQQRKAKAHAALVQSIGVGDRIVTIGGLHGTVESVDEDTARVELAPGTVVTMTRGAISRRLVDADAAGDEQTLPDQTDMP
jgi:preprotein translocase subunit YajC